MTLLKRGVGRSPCCSQCMPRRTPLSLGNNEVYPDEYLFLDYHADEEVWTHDDRCSNLGNIRRPARLFYFIWQSMIPFVSPGGRLLDFTRTEAICLRS